MQPSEGYADQSPDDLSLELFDRQAERSDYQVLKEAHFDLSWLGVRAWIIGASHVFMYRAPDGRVLSEVFSCTEGVPFRGWSLETLEGSSVSHALEGVLDYRFTTHRVPWVDPEPQALRDLINRAHMLGEAQDGLGATFEFPRGDNLTAPMTVITAQAEDSGRRVVVETAHAYPNAGQLVLSRSQIMHTGGAG